jgi:hypothetical protein
MSRHPSGFEVINMILGEILASGEKCIRIVFIKN